MDEPLRSSGKGRRRGSNDSSDSQRMSESDARNYGSYVPRDSEVARRLSSRTLSRTYDNDEDDYIDAVGGTPSMRSVTRDTRQSAKRGTALGLGNDEDDKMKAVFVDAAAMKEKVRANLCKPMHKVTDFYKESGVWQAIAKHYLFENFTLGVIAVNALWISIDTDMNDSELLLNAHPVFQVAENFFCGYFFIEWTVRFMAFKRKRDGLRDRWFTFDSGMVLLMVLETWVMAVVALAAGGGGTGGMGNASVLRVARLLRLSRMARMARLLRAMPELMILIKGMVAAMRSVFFTLFLLVIIMYVFAVAFTQLTDGTQVGDMHFKSVPDSMYTLLLYGTLLDNVGPLADRLGRESLFLGAVFFFFVLLGALTVMNMLIGVLCEVVSAVAATEREEMLVGYVNRKVRKIVEELDQDGGGTISKDEFVQILENMEAVKALQDVGVDVVGLVDFADVIFEEEEDLSFPKFMEVVLQLRGSNNATVKDVVDLRKLVRTETMRTNLLLERMQDVMKIQQAEIQKTILHSPRKHSEAHMSAANSSSNLEDELGGHPIDSRPSHKSKASSHMSENKALDAEISGKIPGEGKRSRVTTARNTLVQDLVVESDWLPWPAPSSDYVQLMREKSTESLGSDKADGIPLESDDAKKLWHGTKAGNLKHEPLLAELRGLWKPCDLTQVQHQVAKRGELEKILESPVYWKALKCIPENSMGTTSDPVLARLEAARAALDGTQAGAATKQSDLARGKQSRPAKDTGPSDSNAVEQCPTWLPALRGQMSTLSKVMAVGLSEVMKIQEELSHNGIGNAKHNGDAVSSAG